MHKPVLVTPPAEWPVSLERVRLHCRVDGPELVEGEDTPKGDEDDLLEGLTAAAVSHLDGYTGILGRCIMQQTWRQDFDAFAREMRLPLPASEIVSVTYEAASGQSSVMSSSRYKLLHDARGSYLRISDMTDLPAVAREPASVSITFTAGAETADDVPAAIRQAILLMVGHWYANREAVVTGTIATTLPLAADSLLQPWRRVGV